MSDLEFSDQEDNYFEDGNYGDDYEEDEIYEERSSSPIPENDTPECIYCGKSLLSVPHTCGATQGCKDKNSIIIFNCQCNWHKQIKKL